MFRPSVACPMMASTSTGAFSGSIRQRPTRPTLAIAGPRSPQLLRARQIGSAVWPTRCSLGQSSGADRHEDGDLHGAPDLFEFAQCCLDLRPARLMAQYARGQPWPGRPVEVAAEEGPRLPTSLPCCKRQSCPRRHQEVAALHERADKLRRLPGRRLSGNSIPHSAGGGCSDCSPGHDAFPILGRPGA